MSQREYLQLVRESGHSLLTLINDILDFSKIEAGRLDLDRIVFSLRDRIGDTMKSLAIRAQNKGLELACRIHPEVPDSLIGDPARLGQVIINLVGNATKFTEQGEIVLEVLNESKTEREAVLLFEVRDTGVGIAEEQLRQDLRGFHAGRLVHDAQVWRDRIGAGHFVTHRGHDGWAHLGRKPSGAREFVSLHQPV